MLMSKSDDASDELNTLVRKIGETLIAEARDPVSLVHTLADPGSFVQKHGFQIPEGTTVQVRSLTIVGSDLTPTPDATGQCPKGWVAQQTTILVSLPVLVVSAEICKVR